MPSSSLIRQSGRARRTTTAYANVLNQFHMGITNSDVRGRIMHVELVKTERRPCIFNREVIHLTRGIRRCVQLENGLPVMSKWHRKIATIARFFKLKSLPLCYSQRWMSQRDVDYALKFGMIFGFIAGILYHFYDFLSSRLCGFYFFCESLRQRTNEAVFRCVKKFCMLY